MTIEEACKILEIDTTASPSEIRRAFRVAAHKHHPDHGGDEKVFMRVSHAYNLLRGRTVPESVTPNWTPKGAGSTWTANEDVEDEALWREIEMYEAIYRATRDRMIKSVVKEERAKAKAEGKMIRNIYIDSEKGTVDVEYWDDKMLKSRHVGI